jgi:serine/threonine protein kinase
MKRTDTDFYARKQGKELFVEFLGWYPGKDYIGLVMEYCRYGDVSRCFPGPLSEEKAWTLCSQLLEGLQILHGMGITHRDIKPQVYPQCSLPFSG